MNLTLILERWENEKHLLTVDDCISQLKMAASGEIREPYTLDSRSPFKRHNGMSIKAAIDAEQKEGGSFFDWALEKMQWFTLDGAAHKYLCEVQNGTQDDKAGQTLSLSSEVVIKTDVMEVLKYGPKLYDVIANRNGWKLDELAQDFRDMREQGSVVKTSIKRYSKHFPK